MGSFRWNGEMQEDAPPHARTSTPSPLPGAQESDRTEPSHPDETLVLFSPFSCSSGEGGRGAEGQSYGFSGLMTPASMAASAGVGTS